jgi:hypothetical protein
MPGEHPMSDLDDELRALLAVEPSPEFAARVRERLRTEPVSDPRWKWAWIPLAAAAAVVVLAAYAAVSREAVIPPQPPAVATGPASLPPTSAPASPAPATRHKESAAAVAPPERSPRIRRRIPIQPQRVVATVIDRRDPEILIDSRQKVALVRLIAMTQRGTMVASGLAEPSDAPISVTEAVEVAPLVVDQLQVPPIATQKQPWQ